jgi:hypothetical protein
MVDDAAASERILTGIVLAAALLFGVVIAILVIGMRG